MDARRSPTSTLRRVAVMAALAALVVPAAPAEAATKKKRQPVVTSVSPMTAEVNDVLTIRGRYFRRGVNRNTVVFRRDGAKAVFEKAHLATRKMMKVRIPETLVPFMQQVGLERVATPFRIRVLAKRFGKRFTSLSRSPVIGPDSPPPPPPPPTNAPSDGDCDGDGISNGNETDDDADGLADDVELSLGLDPCNPDTDGDQVEDRWEYDCDRNGVLNRDETDDDKDLLTDSVEGQIGSDPCATDTDGDGVEDSYEHKSAVDLNDDEYQTPNQSLGYPSQRPYPNVLFNDAKVDHDGDGLTLKEEYDLWVYTYSVTKTATRPATPAAFASHVLSYTAGLQYSDYERCPSASNPSYCSPDGRDNGRRVPTLAADNYVKWFGTGSSNVCGGSPCNELGFLKWAQQNGYETVVLNDGNDWFDHVGRNPYHLLDVDRSGAGCVTPTDTRCGVSGVLGQPGPTEHQFSDELTMFDRNANGFVADGERDEDADGLTNFDEAKSRMQPGYWAACYQVEEPYPVQYAGTSHVDADSDDDGVRDGADDQDHDDVPNVMELSRIMASGLDDTEDGSPDGVITVGVPGRGFSHCNVDKDAPKPPETNHVDSYGWVNPFNPCLPDTESRSCSHHFEFGSIPAPFNAASPKWVSTQ